MRCKLLLALCVSMLFPAQCLARDSWNVCLAELGDLASTDGRGAFFELFELFRASSPDVDWVLKIRPFARSVHDLQQGRCDLHLPFILAQESLPGVHYGSGQLGRAYFFLYSRRAALLTLEQLQDPRHNVSLRQIEASGVPAPIADRLQPLLGRAVSASELRALVPEPIYLQRLQSLVFPYRVDADRAHQHVLGVPVEASNSVQSSLKRLAAGRIDGYINASDQVEPSIDALGLRDDLYAQLFAIYQVGWLRSDSERGRRADAALLQALQPVQASGQYRQLIDRYIKSDWQVDP